jgi:hypothetical protein
MEKELPFTTNPEQLARLETPAPLGDIAERAKRTLRPIAPAPEFRTRLREGLQIAARHQQAQRIMIRPTSQQHWGWLIGAAALGSAAGLAAILMRSRQANGSSTRQITRKVDHEANR